MSTAVKEEIMRDSKLRRMLLIVAVILTVCLAAGCGRGKEGSTLEEVSLQSADSETAEEKDTSEEQMSENASEETSGREKKSEEKLCVFVCGQVAAPGVYELAPDSRIYQAVEAAGGLLETAAGDYVNQAEPVADGQRVYIPSVEEVQTEGSRPDSAGGDVSLSTAASDGRVNLNTAGKEELMTLTGIGERKAEAIIQYRETSGGFGSIEELMQVEGIKEGTFEKIKEDIVI